MSERRGAAGRPRGSRRPGRRPGARPAAGPGAAGVDTSGSLTAVTAAGRPTGSPAPRPRFTGRAVVLVMVLAVLTMSYVSSLNAYLRQRAHIAEVKAQIAESEAAIDSLEREKERWDDPAYVQAQARERFGYLMPGETSYVVLDEDGEPLGSTATLSDPDAVVREQPVAWWETTWESVRLAGNPPPAEKTGKPPATQIDGSTERTP